MSAPMPARILALTLALLAAATGARAGTTWFGPQLSVPFAALDAGNGELGCDVGVSATEMHRAHAGAGVDFVYHYWPVSPKFKADYDRQLAGRSNRVIDGSEWAISAFQVSGHVKLVAPLGDRHAHWIKTGIGLYRVDRRLTGLSGTRLTLAPGWYTSAGLDFVTGTGTALGVHATFQQVWESDFFGRDFRAFSAGTHLLFGR